MMCRFGVTGYLLLYCAFEWPVVAVDLCFRSHSQFFDDQRTCTSHKILNLFSMALSRTAKLIQFINYRAVPTTGTAVDACEPVRRQSYHSLCRCSNYHIRWQTDSGEVRASSSRYICRTRLSTPCRMLVWLAPCTSLHADSWLLTSTLTWC